jgi:hypothetical protein
MTVEKFVVSKDKFIDNFLYPLSRFDLDDKPAQMVLDDDLIGITHTKERDIILKCTLKDVKGKIDTPVILRDIPRLISAIGFVSESMLTFSLDPTNITYVDSQIKFKSYFLDSRFFDSKIPLKIKKIEDIKFDVSFRLDQLSLSKIRKSKQFCKDSEKLYFSGTDSGILVERSDAENSTIDSISFKITNDFEGDPFSAKPIHNKIFDLISEKTEDIVVQINNEFGIFIFTVNTDTYNLKYITSALRK